MVNGNKKVWKIPVPTAARVAIALILVAVGYVLLIGQFAYNWFAFANVWTRRLYPVLCIAIAGLGWGFSQNNVPNAIKFGLTSIAVNICSLLFVGGAIYLSDMSQGTNYANGSIMIGLDVMSGLAVFNNIISQLPAILGVVAVVLGVIALYLGDGWDEYMTAILETAMVLVLIWIFKVAIV